MADCVTLHLVDLKLADGVEILLVVDTACSQLGSDFSRYANNSEDQLTLYAVAGYPSY